MKFTVGTAAKETGKAKSTISRYIKQGRLSAEKTANGSYAIDAAELFRVFPRVEWSNGSRNGEIERSATHKNTHETGVLEAKLEAAEQRIADKDKTIDDLRRRLDEESEERRRLTMMLTYQRPKKKTLLNRISGLIRPERSI